MILELCLVSYSSKTNEVLNRRRMKRLWGAQLTQKDKNYILAKQVTLRTIKITYFESRTHWPDLRLVNVQEKRKSRHYLSWRSDRLKH